MAGVREECKKLFVVHPRLLGNWGRGHEDPIEERRVVIHRAHLKVRELPKRSVGRTWGGGRGDVREE